MRKFLNILRAELSYALSLLGIVRVRHLPTFVSVEPANFCQLHCPECPVGAGVHKNGTKSKELLSLDKFKHILTQVQNSVHTIQFFFQGEPLLNPQLPDMVKLTQNAGIYTIVSTNALAITPLLAERIMNAGLSRIIVSIDGLSEESYSAYRVGGSLHKALEGLTREELENIIVAYEPIWAIGTGKTATSEDANQAIKAIREKIKEEFGTDDVTILYGGSVKAENAKELFTMSDIDGGLVGGASLKADSFSGIVNFDK